MPATAAAAATRSSSAAATAHSRTCHLWLDHRAGLQAGQGRAGLGRLPGPLRHRDPPPPGPGQLRVLLLLGCLVRRPPRATPDCGAAARTRPRREGGRTPPHHRKHRPGHGRCARSAPGFPRGSRCSAGGPHGPRRPRPGSCRPWSTRSRQAAACTSTSRI